MNSSSHPLDKRDRQKSNSAVSLGRWLGRPACVAPLVSHLDQAGQAGLGLGTMPGSGPLICRSLSVQLALMIHANDRETR